jgi:hypothetical protein
LVYRPQSSSASRLTAGASARSLPLIGQCLDELDPDFDPTRHRHIAPYPYRTLDLFVCGDQSGRTSAPINPHAMQTMRFFCRSPKMM